MEDDLSFQSGHRQSHTPRNRLGSRLNRLGSRLLSDTIGGGRVFSDLLRERMFFVLTPNSRLGRRIALVLKEVVNEEARDRVDRWKGN